jgi:hypothetical protein
LLSKLEVLSSISRTKRKNKIKKPLYIGKVILRTQTHTILFKEYVNIPLNVDLRDY